MTEPKEIQFHRAYVGGYSRLLAGIALDFI